MTERRTTLRDLRPASTEANGGTFTAAGGAALRVGFLEADVLRIEFLPDGERRIDRTWSVTDADGDVPPEGRRRDDTARFTRPAIEWRSPSDAAVGAAAADGPPRRLVADSGIIQVGIDLEDAALDVRDAAGRTILRDLPGRAYLCGEHGSVWHTLTRSLDDHYYGLGEVSGPLDRHGRRFHLRPKDALGYDARSGDPLYKHLPFYLQRTADGLWTGLFYDNPTELWVDLGCEVDNYVGPYRYLHASGGDIDLYVLHGPTPERVLERYAWLTGNTPMPPRWSLGYLASTMSYTEGTEPRAAIASFADRCRSLGIPVELFHLSSGYTFGADGNRYVFTWDPSRFPDPAADIAAIHAHGLRIAANIKPALLTTHPAYADARAVLVKRAPAAPATFVRRDPDPDPARPPEPHTEHFWGGEAGFVDFTDPAGYAWCQDRVRSTLLGNGIDATWNDNNEYDIEETDAACHAGPLGQLRPVQTLLMTRASWEIQRRHRPGERPFVLTRSGMAGSQRYAQTWSGDNRSDWDSLRYNVPMGLGLAMSGWPNNGHDVGGFAGPAPNPELFVRWVQNGIFHPRFCIHSWNDDGTATEPWMYPEMLPHVRSAIRLRYRLLPYLYTLFWRAHSAAEPIHRPLCYAFPDDPASLTESFAFLLGPSLLVPGVFGPGQRRRELRLPPGAWVDWHDGVRYPGGAPATLPAPLERPPLLAREGSIVPTAPVPDRMGGPRPHARTMVAFPPADGSRAIGLLYEDDGSSEAYRDGAYALLDLAADARTDRVKVSATIRHDGFRLPYDELEWVFPPGEARACGSDQTVVAAWIDDDGRQRLRTRIEL